MNDKRLPTGKLAGMAFGEALELAANLFRATHYEVGSKVRQTIKDIGGTMPEHLPPAEDIVMVGRRLKNMIGNAPKKPK